MLHLILFIKLSEIRKINIKEEEEEGIKQT